jgi:hypothetical protein
MKNLILFLFALSTQAATLNLSWDNNPASEGVTGYNVYSSFNGGVSTKLLTVATNAATLPSLPSGTYMFFVTATNTSSEGPKSVPVNQFLGAPSAPVNFKLTITLP